MRPVSRCLGLLLLAASSCLSATPVVSNELLAEVAGGARAMLADAESHKLYVTLNPSCSEPACSVNSSLTVANLTVADLPSSSVEHHWIWSVIERPAVQAAITRPGSRAVVDWGALLGMRDIDSAIKYDRQPHYSAAIMMANLIEFDDPSDLGYLDESTKKVIVYPVTNFAFTREVIENSTERVAFGFVGENYTSTSAEGSMHNVTGGRLTITLSAYAFEGLGTWLPHLSHSSSTNQIDVQVDNITTTSGFNTSRFALEFFVAGNAGRKKDAEPYRQSTRTLDDEHTPGIFATQELVFPGYNDTLQSYLQWRPVVYSTPDRDLSYSTDVNVSAPANVDRPNVVLNATILYAFYGEDLQDMTVRKINVTMGAKGDGFYRKSHFQAWTFTLGTGVPIHNGMSPALILALTTMLVVFTLAMIGFCLVFAIRKFKRRDTNSASYARI